MALHGPIYVGRVTVGYWSARRLTPESQGVNTYKCDVEWTPVGQVRKPGGKHALSAAFQLEHDYADGALVLASKVLAAGAQAMVGVEAKSRV